jgi:L-lactate permease
VIVLLSGWRAIARAPVVVSSAAAVIATTACLHAVFFGAGRYGLAVAPFVAMLATLAFARRPSGDAAVRALEARAAAEPSASWEQPAEEVPSARTRSSCGAVARRAD